MLGTRKYGAEFRADLAAVGQQNLTARGLEELPSSAVTWKLDAEGFDQLVTELMRRGDDIPLRQLLLKLPAEAAHLLETGDSDELATLLDRLLSLGALAVQFERPEWLDLRAFVSIYHLGFDNHGYERNSTAVIQLWIDVVARVYGLGSLAVRLNDWSAVRKLAIQHPPGESFRHYRSWLRHALTMGSRANVLNRDKNAGLIARCHNVVRAVSSLRPDRTVDDEAILDSLCQFDIVGCLVVIDERKSFDSGNFYPGFAGYYSRRSEPAIVRLITDPVMRTVIFEGDDRFLADALTRVFTQAKNESFPFGAWDGVDSQTIVRFIDEHRTPTT